LQEGGTRLSLLLLAP